MKRLFITLWIFLFITCYKAESQVQLTVDKWMEYVEELASETEDEGQIETLYAELSYLVEHPFELNLVTEEQLKKLPFLSDLQIQSLLTYRQRYGKMLTVYELKNVDELDFQTISLLLPFVYISEYTVDKRPITVKNLLKLNSNELQIRYDQCFQQKKGYKSYPDSVLNDYPNRKYWGEPFYTSLRYSYAFDERIQFGIVAEKDAGEPFWNSYHKGYDYYSAHLCLKDMGMLKTLLVGDYKMSFGQGLVISNDFSPSRNAIVAQAERRNYGFRRHFSTNENDYFRGTAATVVLKKFNLSLFYSYRKLDAGLDSLTFTSVKTDGLHRLQRDWEKRHTIPMQTYGGNIQYATPNFCLGATFLSYSFGKYTMQPDLKPYNLFYFRGSNQWNASVDYLLKNRFVKLYGETAISKNGAVSTLNSIQLTPASYISFLALYRYYDRRYQAYFGNAFAQGSMVQNEQGLYLGLQLVPVKHWKVSGYVDLFRFPWLKYGVSAPSSGYEYMGQVDYTAGRNFSTYIRYRYKLKEKDGKTEKSGSTRIVPYAGQRIRWQCIYSWTPSWVLKTSADAVLYNEGTDEKSRGILLAQSIGWKPGTSPIQADLYAAWFHTDDYNSRLSSYEKNILYTFNMPSFYGRGIRFSFSFRWDLLSHLSLSFKLGHTHYSDRNRIGTDQEEIEGSNKTDLYALIRWKF